MKYSWSFDSEDVFSYEFDTIDECLEDARNDDKDAKVVFVKGTVEIEPKIYADTLLDSLESGIYDDYPFAGRFALHDWKKCSEIQELEDELNQALKEWMTKHNYSVGWSEIINIKEYKL